MALDRDSQRDPRDPCRPYRPTVSIGGLRIELIPSDEIDVDETFAMELTALTSAVSNVVSSTANSLTLVGTAGFPTSGAGYIASGTSQRRFTWNGISANTLNNASGHGSPAKGARVQSEPAVDLSYSGDMDISANSNGQYVGLAIRSVGSSDWTNGEASIENAVSDNPNEEDSWLDIAVRELVVSSGRSASARILLRAGGTCGSCDTGCDTGCEVLCETCDTTCETGCEVSCEVGCEVSCQAGCDYCDWCDSGPCGC